ncbi:MAG: hypothetical protein MUC35_04520 [Candidatus Margulisbacteria bacterium]|jgi:hypothetical protein|nr:hypothetical protein [Candidatus Margulisiibacteriota bacterium]
MNILDLVSIGLEAVAVVICLLIATQKNKSWAWFLALTFAIYVGYDLARYFGWQAVPILLYVGFLIASLSAVWAVWQIYRSS